LRSIQAWEAGISYPGTENLQALISCFLEAGGFARGREAAEAKAFWSAAVCESPRNRPPFDIDWFADLLARQTAAEETHARAALIPPSAGLTNNRALRLIDWRDARPASPPSGEPEESFSGLVLGFRGRTTLTQPQLASEVGASLRSVQGWEAGITVPGLESLQALVACFLNAGAFAEGREAAQAEALWSAALRDSPRHRPPFDAAWFSDLLAMRLAAREPTVGSSADVIVATPSNAGSRAVRLLEWGDRT
jgi:transcriptional regulator with XRE-family HTH domain